MDHFPIEPRPWEPEPLYLPSDDTQFGDPSRPGHSGALDDGVERDTGDLPGSHVIITDLA